MTLDFDDVAVRDPDGSVWLKGAERVAYSKPGLQYLTGVAPKFCGHTVEGYSSNPRATAQAHPFGPQLWYCPAHDPYNPRLLLQVIPLTRAGYALAHPAGTPETNRAGFIQCEVFGFASESGRWPEESLRAYAEDVVAPVCVAAAIDWRNVTVPTMGPESYGPGDWRLDAPDPGYWWNGRTQHQRVWWNEHWDQGLLDEDVVTDECEQLIVGVPSPPPTIDPYPTLRTVGVL